VRRETLRSARRIEESTWTLTVDSKKQFNEQGFNSILKEQSVVEDLFQFLTFKLLNISSSSKVA